MVDIREMGSSAECDVSTTARDETSEHAFPRLELDIEKYRSMACQEGESEEDAQAYLEALFHILHMLADMNMDLNAFPNPLIGASEKPVKDSEHPVSHSCNSIDFNVVASKNKGKDVSDD